MKLRKSKNFTAKELGEQIDITEGGILSYENDNAYPSRNVLLKLVNILGNDVLCDDYSKFITTEYGPIIKQWRKNNNLTCEQAAKNIGIPIRTLYSLENMVCIIGREKFQQHKVKLLEIVNNN